MTTLQKFARFALDTTIDDIPPDVRDYAKIVLLDTLACGLAAARLERSRIAQRVAARFGGPAEATVFGLQQRVAAVNAAYANAEMMNALDADDTFYNAAHFAAIVLAAALAEAERLGAPGAALLRAFTLGFEVNARVNLASALMEYDGGQFRWSQLVGNGGDAFGAATACGVLGGFSADTLANALGLAGWTAPTAKAANMATRTAFNSFKYAPYGCVAQVGLTAAALAEEGYVGEHDVLDITPGFFEAQGFLTAYRELLDCAPGSPWWIRDTALKPYPSCRYTHAAIDAVTEYRSRHGLEIADIDAIEVRLNPVAYAMHFFRHPSPAIAADHRAPLHGAFNIPYVIAVALLGRRRGPQWYDPANLRDPAVWELARRITTAPDPALAVAWRDEVLNSALRRPRRNRASLTLTVRGVEHLVESDYNQGDPWSDDTRADRDWVARKFHDFCADIMAPRQREALIECVWNLEDVDDVSRAITPLLGTAR